MAPEDPGEGFAVTRCTACAREVLCYVELDGGNREQLRCVHCAMPVEGATRWLDDRGLEDLGYVIVSTGEDCGRGECGTACRRGAAERA